MNNSTSAVPPGIRERCGVLDDHYMQVWDDMRWWCEGVFFTGFGVAGFVANIISVAVLATKAMRKHTFNQLLIALAICDMLFIVVSVPVYSFTLFNILSGYQWFSLLYVYFLYPMSPVALCASVYMTLSITVERYLAVCKPILYRNLNTTMSPSRRMAIYVTPVALISVCLNIPKFMETEAKTSSSAENGTTTTEIHASDMRLNPTYMLYYTISQIFHPTLTTGILPMGALIYMNTSIFIGVRRRTFTMRNQRRQANNCSSITNNAPRSQNTANGESQNNGASSSPVQQTRSPSQNASAGNGASNAVNTAVSTTSAAARIEQNRRQRQASNENNLALVLIGIVLMHIACHTLRVFLAGTAVHLIKDTLYCMEKQGSYVPPLWTMCAESVSSLLIMINFSGNFLIYCSALKPFKRKLSWLLGVWRRRGNIGTPPSGEEAGNVITAETRIDCPVSHDSISRTHSCPPGDERKRRLLACPKERNRAAAALSLQSRSVSQEEGTDERTISEV